MSDDSLAYATADQRRRDREALRRRWYAEGWFTSRSMADEMRVAAERSPEVELVFHSDDHPARATLGEMYARAQRIAANLQRLGLRQGDVLAIQMPSWVESALAFEAGLLAGAVIVPIVHIYGPAEVGFILRQSRAKVLVMPDRWRHVDYAERLEGLRDGSELEHIVVVGDAPPAGTIPWATLEAEGARYEPPVIDPDDVCLLVYTSGTTAEPKGVQHSHNTLGAEVRAGTALFEHTEQVSLGMFPFGHIAGALILGRLFIYGTSTVLIDRWDAHEAAALVEQHGVEASAGTPFHLQTLIDAAEADGRDLSSFRRIVTGAASVPPVLVERFDAAGIPVIRQYGSSEHPTVTSSVESDSLHHRAFTDGRAVAGNEVRIVDDAGREVPPGVDGEVTTRGPELFVGYRNPELDAVSFLPDGWFLTGDIGHFEEDGYLVITDRKKDVIIRGGENISSKEVEDVLARHPGVAEAAAVAMPDERYGERVCAYAILRPGAALDLPALIDHFAAHGVAKQKTPERLVIVDELPRTPSGKVKKFELRQQLRTEMSAG